MFQSQKDGTVGKLAAAFAHEFKHPDGIMARANCCVEDLSRDSPTGW